MRCINCKKKSIAMFKGTSLCEDHLKLEKFKDKVDKEIDRIINSLNTKY